MPKMKLRGMFAVCGVLSKSYVDNCLRYWNAIPAHRPECLFVESYKSCNVRWSVTTPQLLLIHQPEQFEMRAAAIFVVSAMLIGWPSNFSIV